jgi:putative Holliday junction resolvase
MAKVVMPDLNVPHGILMGFDFGFRRIGVAIGQTATGTASALATVAHSEQPDWQSIEQLIKEWRPVALVVGLPLDAGGHDTEMSRAARKFAAGLESRYEKPIFFIDERLTSVAAGAQFVQARSEGRARRKDARKLDAMAAKIILENWLQSQTQT